MVENSQGLAELSNVWQSTAKLLLEGSAEVALKLIVAILIVILGWVIGSLLSKAVAHLIKAVKLDKALEVAGAKDLVRKSGFELNSGLFLGELVKWYVIVVSFITVFDILGLQVVNTFLRGVVLAYIPQVIAAVLILLVAIVVASVLQKTVVASAKAAGFSNAALLGTITKWAIWVTAFLAALIQLDIAVRIIELLFMGFMIALSLALGLSFGLGGKEAAKDYIEKIRKEVKD